ncbi:MAG: translation initiation factor IF-3 [Actinomycetota bacterium]
MNDRIRAAEVRLVGPDGAQIGVFSSVDALRIARELDLDLVEVAPMAKPPVCRLLDYGKYKYEQALKAKEAKKKQSQIVVKEMKMRPKIDRHDYQTKKSHIEKFLSQGHKVKLTIMFRGREMAHTELGARILTKLTEDLSPVANVETPAKLDGRNMTMVFTPNKKKSARKGAVTSEHAEAVSE